MNEDPYADAALYDLEYADHTEDIGYYTTLASLSTGPLLELGCGTGRLTLPMARRGACVDGVDASDGMLEGLRLKLAAEPAPVQARIRFWNGDFREPNPHLRTDYEWVLWPFNAIHHCKSPDDVVRTLGWVREHLGPDGRVALDAYLPDRTLYDRDPKKTYEHRIFKDPRTGQPLHTWEQGWWDEASRTHHVVYTYKHRDQTEERAHLTLRMFEQEELASLFREAGFRITFSAEDFQGTPLRPASLKWVIQLTPT
ncbi:MAG: class I SAM-dependent methyltransferase [Myxococcota bacterium]